MLDEENDQDKELSRNRILGLDSIGESARLGEFAALTDPLRNYRDAFENSSIARMHEQMRAISATTGVGKMLADAESATERLRDCFEVSLAKEMATFKFPELGTMNSFNMSDVCEPPSLMDYSHVHQAIEPPPPEEPGEAAKILIKLQEELDALNEEHANNPSKHPAIVVMLADGKKIYTQTAQNVGDQTITLTGLEFGSGDHRELTVGISTASFYSDVLDIGPRKPELKVIEDAKEGE